MKYEDPLIDEARYGNVNVSSASPIKTFFKLLSALMVLLIVGYLVLSLLIYQVIEHISFETEKKLLTPLSNVVLDELAVDRSFVEKTAALQRIADKIRNHAIAANSNHPLSTMDITMHYSDEGSVNAMALPGGHIVVMRGLIEIVPNENMLAMVIAHEMGHVIERDAVHRLGRIVLTNTVLLSLFGSNGQLITGQSNAFIENGYSREAESRADENAMALLDNTYGHVYGAAELFNLFAIVEPSQSRWVELSSDHPLPLNRRKAVIKLIETKAYDSYPKKAIPLPSALKTTSQ